MSKRISIKKNESFQEGFSQIGLKWSRNQK